MRGTRACTARKLFPPRGARAGTPLRRGQARRLAHRGRTPKIAPPPPPLPRGCHVPAGAILTYFNLFKPIWLTVVILAGYLLVMHLITFAAYVRLGRRERR